LPKSFFLFFVFLPAFAFTQQRFQFSAPKMGSPFHLIFYADDSVKAATLAKASFHLIDSLNAIFSDYMENSELNRLSRTAGSGQAVSVSPALYDILLTSKDAAAASKGAFDVTIGPLSRLWRQARREKTFPAATLVAAAREKTGMRYLLIDTAGKKITLLKKGMQLDLGGIAKGHVAQQVIYFLRSNGITSALADAGGDLACSGPPPGKEGWTIGINLPESETELLTQTVLVHNLAVATSGDLYQYMEHEGKRFSHILDPRSGYGVPFQRNVTVIAPDGATADWLATACSILSWRQCKKLVKRYRADLLITQIKNGKLIYSITRGMKDRLRM
jgi:thiamine biosynthesis lipoprotein